ncbi:unnamed protein product [Rhizoctonia solani]|uniref:Uncharacterized protein n=1 Tax=Rhizoctonia solani TaxID=456999 RepID=A0A8H3BFC9_9AGAM|nr:unnamed protein product [Rhizoctonia solani]
MHGVPGQNRHSTGGSRQRHRRHSIFGRLLIRPSAPYYLDLDIIAQQIDAATMTAQTNSPDNPLRRGPPMPLGDNVDYFCVDAATPPVAAHPSGTFLRIKLDNPHSDAPLRSSQLIRGRVFIHSPISLQIPHLSLRVYFESRTLYWSLEYKKQDIPEELAPGTIMSPIASISTLDVLARVMRHEVHRGVVPASNLTISWGSRIDVQANQELVLPFSFIIPKTMSVTEWSGNPNVPRDLCRVKRSPPSTLRDSRFGSVQWVVEAIMDIGANATSKQDPQTLLRQPTDSQVVTRIEFPFVPSLEDVSSLRDEPFFGEDPGKDPFGSQRLSEEDLESGKKVAMERVRMHGEKWEVYVKELPVGKNSVWSEVYTPAGATIHTNSSSLPVILFLKHKGAQPSLKDFFRTAKPKPVHLLRALVTLSRITSTRGGRETEPHINSTVACQQEHLFGSESSSSSTPAGLAIFHEDPKPVELNLALDLRSKTPSGDQPSNLAKFLTPSFRTPNFQHEFLLTILLLFAEDKEEVYSARFTVQVAPASGEIGNQLAAFEEAAGFEAPPPTFDESVGAS